MNAKTIEVIELIKARPDAWYVHRTEENYDLFLDLYERVGYALSAPKAIAEWRERSRHTWKAQDYALPASCTGGLAAGKIVSSWGTLPRAKNILYGHSVCMEKTAVSAATLFAQSLRSIHQMERYPMIGYWAGSYANHSRFTSLFQRPNGWKIAGQLEVEVVCLLQPQALQYSVEPQLAVEELRDEHLGALSPLHFQWFKEVHHESPLLAHLHSCKRFALTDTSSGALRYVAIAQRAPQEFTAANVFLRTWLFPAEGTRIDQSQCAALRSVPELNAAALQLALPQGISSELNGLGEPIHHAFWALTPRKQLEALKRSFEEAFTSLLSRYSEDDMDALALQFHAATI